VAWPASVSERYRKRALVEALPEEERRQWRLLWTDVAKTLASYPSLASNPLEERSRTHLAPELAIGRRLLHTLLESRADR
jgi:hypothetical protein